RRGVARARRGVARAVQGVASAGYGVASAGYGVARAVRSVARARRVVASASHPSRARLSQCTKSKPSIPKPPTSSRRTISQSKKGGEFSALSTSIILGPYAFF
ncbi:hypothetical protein, partial [Geomicrobium sp. JCM 19038]|uniref:hypothetical protein n=1 Tax=Geomicrobium sp. JCM 19038 TaxID=1460635 RepID=UPI001EE6867A